MELPISPGSPGLAAGTLVTTPDGDKKIEEVVAGDLVLSGVGECKTSFYPVKRAMSKHYNGPILHITIEFPFDGSSLHLRLTPNHICFGDIYQDRAKKSSVVISAFSRPENHEDNPVHLVFVNQKIVGESYNINEAEQIANKTATSKGDAEIERFANFSLDPFRFMPANELKVEAVIPLPIVREKHGETFVTSGEITNITCEHYDGLIYNLNIPQTRNFAANGILVHDSSTYNP